MAAKRSRSARILSWNVNGIRAAAKKGFRDWLAEAKAEIVGIQEVRAEPAAIPAELREPERLHVAFSAAERKGYSGVGLYSQRRPDRIDCSLAEARFDSEGRLQLAHFGRLVIANVYFPNGNGPERDNSRVPYKLDFYRAVFDRVQRLRRSGRRVLVIGDFNTAHKEIDLARPRENRETSGFLPEECAELDRWLATGWVDTFRAFDTAPGRYTWWSQRFGVRARNVGWRIDYVLASPAAMKFVRSAFIQPDVMGSDHCPLGVDVDPAIFE
jgi:exodeoxyribonuclease-3